MLNLPSFISSRLLRSFIYLYVNKSFEYLCVMKCSWLWLYFLISTEPVFQTRLVWHRHIALVTMTMYNITCQPDDGKVDTKLTHLHDWSSMIWSERLKMEEWHLAWVVKSALSLPWLDRRELVYYKVKILSRDPSSQKMRGTWFLIFNLLCVRTQNK